MRHFLFSLFSVCAAREVQFCAYSSSIFDTFTFNSCFITLPLSMAMHSMSIPYIQVRMLGPIYAIRLFL